MFAHDLLFLTDVIRHLYMMIEIDVMSCVRHGVTILFT